ncbi:B12-binding domain-containing radical SAM protein [Geobacter pickeringii]|uniref:B12-binding domain-containing radical SAM protein n=1 Tax=Geobacter pickeringii TaxID=345632 RepID=UPI000B249D02|nr:cobalamin-dependent protein [Geobacter pickeringii]
MSNSHRNTFLSPDKNRRQLRCQLAKQLESGLVVDSIIRSRTGPCDGNRIPRILLIVPYYTRISRPLDIILDNIETKNSDITFREQSCSIVKSLKGVGITHLEEMKRAGIPMGLLRIGTSAKKTGYDVKIIDAVYEGWGDEKGYFTSTEGSSILLYGLSPEALKDKIKLFNPDVVAITCSYTHQWGNACEVADLVKQINSDVPVIMGGVHSNGLPSETLLTAPVDFVILGQADKTFPELLDVLTGRRSCQISEINGIAYRANGEVVHTKKRSFLSDITDIAVPDLSLVDLKLYSGRYHSAGERQLDHGFLVYGFSSFGCNTRCSFCTIPTVQGGWVSMKDQVFEQYLCYLKSQGVTEFMLEDDHLLHDPMWAISVFEKLKKFDLPWMEEGGVSLYNLIALLPEVSEEIIHSSANNESVFRNTISARRKGLTADKFIKAMADSQCYSIYLAVETANSESLDTSNKPKLNAFEAHTKKIVQLFKKYNIKTTCGLMLGFINPDENYFETQRHIENSINYGKMLMQAGATYINTFVFTPLPGAPHFSELRKYTINNTDEGFSHEFGSLDAPDGSWCRDTMSLARIAAIISTVGINGYEQIAKTGTWPISRD